MRFFVQILITCLLNIHNLEAEDFLDYKFYLLCLCLYKILNFLLSAEQNYGNKNLISFVNKKWKFSAQSCNFIFSVSGCSPVPPPAPAPAGPPPERLCGMKASDIDKYSRVVFPIAFLSFHLMYWMIYLTISNEVADDLVYLQ